MISPFSIRTRRRFLHFFIVHLIFIGFFSILVCALVPVLKHVSKPHKNLKMFDFYFVLNRQTSRLGLLLSLLNFTWQNSHALLMRLSTCIFDDSRHILHFSFSSKFEKMHFLSFPFKLMKFCHQRRRFDIDPIFVHKVSA